MKKTGHVAKGHTSKHVGTSKHHALTAKHHPKHHHLSAKGLKEVRADRARAKAKHPHHARGFAIGDLLPVCSFEAVAMSLRLAGQPVSDDEIAWLWELYGEVSIEQALRGFAALYVGSQPFECLYGPGIAAVDADAEPYEQRRRDLEPLGGSDAAVRPAAMLAPLGDFIARHEVDDLGLEFAAAPARLALGVADLDAHAIGHEVHGRLRDWGQLGKQEQLSHASSTPATDGEFNNTGVDLIGGQWLAAVGIVHAGSRRFPSVRASARQCADDRYSFVTDPGVSVILGVEQPGPHAVLATADGWWSWGELWSPWTTAIDEAWAVSWA